MRLFASHAATRTCTIAHASCLSYGSGDWQIGRLLQSRRFDHGMVAFLECLRQLAAWACARDAELRLPHACVVGGARLRAKGGSLTTL